MEQIGSVSETLRMKIEAARSRRERERALFPGVACLRCMDTGYMEFMGRQAPCHCERGVAIEQERQRAAWLERAEREVGIPETLRRDAAAGRYGKPLARQLRERIVDGGGVYLHGGTGRGKSVVASACLLQLVRSTGDVSVSPRRIGIFTTSAGYLQSIRDSYEQGGGGVGVSPD